MSKRPVGKRKHRVTERMKNLAASTLAQKIGYLKIDPPDLPTQSYNPHRIIRVKDELLIVKEGLVEIWHTRFDKLVTALTPGRAFGDMPLLGQTILGTKVITGNTGATVSVMNSKAVKKWVEDNPSIWFELGKRLYQVETDHYKSRFQLADSRIAALLLDLAGQGSTVNGLSHEKIGERVGLNRETVTVILSAMRFDKLIETNKKQITILDKKAMREMSEL